MSDSCDAMDCSLPGSSVYGILQARTLEGVAISFSRGCHGYKMYSVGHVVNNCVISSYGEK